MLGHGDWEETVMKKYCIIFVFNPSYEKVLMQFKNRGPFPYTWNAVGGKIWKDETPREGAIRELREETDLTYLKSNLVVKLSFDCCFDGREYIEESELYVYYTSSVESRVKQKEDEELRWFKVKNIMKMNEKLLAGDGNIKYFMRLIFKKEGRKL